MRDVAIFVALVAVTLAGCKKPTEAEPPPVWKRYTTPDGTCSAEFPEEPHSIERGLQTVPMGRSYALTSADIPPEWQGRGDEGLFDMLRDRISNGGEELTAERKIVVDGYPGREWEFRGGKAPFKLYQRSKVLIREGKLYLLFALTGCPEKDDPDLKRFIDSFRFEKPKS